MILSEELKGQIKLAKVSINKLNFEQNNSGYYG